MKFSDYIRIYSYQEYITYCRQNYLTPVIDVKIEEPGKVCWLLNPKDTDRKKTKPNYVG